MLNRQAHQPAGRPQDGSTAPQAGIEAPAQVQSRTSSGLVGRDLEHRTRIGGL